MEDYWHYHDDDSYDEDESAHYESPTDFFSNTKDNNNYETGLLRENSKTVSLSELMELLLNDAEKVHLLTCLSLPASILLLQCSKWLTEVAKESYFEDPEKMLQKLKLRVDIASRESVIVENTEKIECLICAVDVEEGKAHGLSGCRHFFHTECWKFFIKHSLDTNENMWNFRCPMDGCLELVDIHILKGFFSDEKEVPLRLAIERHFLSDCIENSPRLSWCPNDKGCEGIIYTPKALHPRESVKCNICHLCFCFHCKRPPHSPAFCDQVRRWFDQLDENAPSMVFVMINTKACPNCHARIMKDAGCNHMVCRCRHHFCWICMGDWSKHSGNYFSCNNAQQNAVENGKSKQNEELMFLTNFQKYMIQKDSSKKESNDLDMLANSTLEIPNSEDNLYPFSNSPDALVRLLGSVKSALSIARECIGFAIVRSHYSDHSRNETQLFLHRMGSLEEATENLSQQLSALKNNAPIKVKELQEGISAVKRWVTILEE